MAFNFTEKNLNTIWLVCLANFSWNIHIFYTKNAK